MTDAIRFRILKNLVTDALREIQHANPADRIALIDRLYRLFDDVTPSFTELKNSVILLDESVYRSIEGMDHGLMLSDLIEELA